MTSQPIDLSTRSQVLAAIFSSTEEDLTVYFDAVKRQTKNLREARSHTIRVGSVVTTVNLAPKALEGLRGTVTKITGKRAELTLDQASCDTLSGTRYGHSVPSLPGVPLTCLVVAE